MKIALLIGLLSLLVGCHSTYTRADGTVCTKYEPWCGLAGEDRLVCELDENGGEICTCMPTSYGLPGHDDHESGRNSYSRPER